MSSSINRHIVHGDMSSATFRHWVDTWAQRAVDIIPEEILTEHNAVLTAFMFWNRSGRVNAGRLQEYIDEISASKRTVAVRSIHTFKWVFSSLGKQNPALGLRITVTRRSRELVAATEENYRGVLKAYSKNGKDEDCALLIMLMWYCGLALVDASLLVWEDVNMEQCLIRPRRSKTGSQCRIPFEHGGELHTMLLKAAGDGVLTGPVSSANAIKYNTGLKYLTKKIGYACRAGGLPEGSSAHAFRRAFITRLVHAGVDIATIAVMSGHTSINSISPYFKANDTHLREAIKKAALNPAPETRPDISPDVQADRPGDDRREEAAADVGQGNRQGIGVVKADGRLAVPKRRVAPRYRRRYVPVPRGLRRDSAEPGEAAVLLHPVLPDIPPAAGPSGQTQHVTQV